MERVGRGHAGAVDVCLGTLSNCRRSGLPAMVQKPFVMGHDLGHVEQPFGESARVLSLRTAPLSSLEDAGVFHQRRVMDRLHALQKLPRVPSADAPRDRSESQRIL